jgi:hypothetical protein
MAMASNKVTFVNKVNNKHSIVVSRLSQAPALFFTIRIPELAELADLLTRLFRD